MCIKDSGYFWDCTGAQDFWRDCCKEGRKLTESFRYYRQKSSWAMDGKEEKLWKGIGLSQMHTSSINNAVNECRFKWYNYHILKTIF